LIDQFQQNEDFVQFVTNLIYGGSPIDDCPQQVLKTVQLYREYQLCIWRKLSGSETFLVIQAIERKEQTQTVISEEVIPLSLWSSIINGLELNDIMPHCKFWACVNSFVLACQHFLMPFISISDRLRIELYPRAESLLKSSCKTQFLKEECEMDLVLIEELELRIVLSSTNKT